MNSNVKYEIKKKKTDANREKGVFFHSINRFPLSIEMPFEK